MRHPKQALVVLFAALFLATVSQPAFALLYGGSYGAPIIPDAVGDSLAPVPNGGTDISALYFANSGGYHYFRMDLNGALTGTDYANIYTIIFNSPVLSNINSLTAVGAPFTAINISPNIGVGNFLFSDFNKLEWKIPESQLFGPFSITGLTFSYASPFVLDTMKTVTTPIPSAVWLIGSGLLGLIGLQRRRARKA